MLGDIVELTVVVRDIEAAIERFTGLFGLKVHHRAESKEFGFKNAILPTGIGHIELLQPTDAEKPVGRFLAKHGEGVYLVGFECQDIPGSVERFRRRRRRCAPRCVSSCARSSATPRRCGARTRGAASTASSARRWARAAGSR